MITIDYRSGVSATFFTSSVSLMGDDVSVAVELDLNSAPFNVDYRGNFPILTAISVYDTINNLYLPPSEVHSATFKKGVLSVVLTHPIPRGFTDANGNVTPQRAINAQYVYVVG